MTEATGQSGDAGSASRPTVYLSYNGHRALVVEPDGRAFEIVQQDRSEGAREAVPLDECSVQQWVVRYQARPMEVDPGAFPYEAIRGVVDDESELARMRFMFVCVLEPRWPDLRQQAAQILGRQLTGADPSMIATFRARLLAEPPYKDDSSTADAPLTGAAADILAEVVAKWGHHPALVSSNPST